MNGIYYDLAFEDYVKAPGINQSGLKLIGRSPEHYFDRYLAPDRDEQEETKALRQGHLVHAAVLEPARFDDRYIAALRPENYPDALRTIEDLKSALDRLAVPYKKSGKKGELLDALKAAWPEAPIWDDIVADYAMRTSNRDILQLADWDLCDDIRRKVRSHPMAQTLREHARHEVSIFWLDDETDVPCKIRLDTMMMGDIKGVLDTKTCEDASPSAFKRQCANYGYHIQAAFYLDGWAKATESMAVADAFLFEALEKKRPHGIAYYFADEEMIREGRAEYRRLLKIYAECRLTNCWPGYPIEVQKISLPKWALKGALNEF